MTLELFSIVFGKVSNLICAIALLVLLIQSSKKQTIESYLKVIALASFFIALKALFN